MVDKTVVAAKAIVPAPGPLRSSKCFVSLNYNVDGFHTTHHTKLTAKLDADNVAYFKMDLDAVLNNKPVRFKYIEKLKAFLQKDQSAIDPKDMDHYTKTMDEVDVQQYEKSLEDRMVNDTVYVEAVLEFVGLKALAKSYKALSVSQDCGYAGLSKEVKDFGQLQAVCRQMLDSFSAAKADCEKKVDLLQSNLSLEHLKEMVNEKVNVWANEDSVDSTLCEIVKSRDIELVRPINDGEFQTILVKVEEELDNVLSHHLGHAIKAFEEDIHRLVTSLQDEALLVYYSCLADELRTMKANLDVKQAAVIKMGSWSSTKKAVDVVSGLLLSVGLALEVVPVAGQVVGTGMMLVGGVMKAVATLATMFVDHKERQEKDQQKASIQLLKDLGQVVVDHCRFLNKAKTVVESARAAKALMGKDMSSRKAEVNEAIMNIT